VPPVTHTHALFADQSHSIPDNLVALLGYSRAWNCSDPQRLIRSIFAKINALLAMSVTCGNSENICSLGVLPPVPLSGPTCRVDGQREACLLPGIGGEPFGASFAETVSVSAMLSVKTGYQQLGRELPTRALKERQS
jgi:hypothetical protein